MASSDENSPHAPHGQGEGDIEMGQPNNANETHSATPTSSHAPQSPSPTPEAPAIELFRRDTDRSVRFYKAALNGDWETAIGLFENDPPPREILRARITMAHDTALHVAAGARQTKFAEKLIGIMEPEDLALKDINGNTAFCLAAAAGAKSIAEIMIDRNRDLPTLRGNNDVTPLYMAAKYGQCEMVRFLHPKTEEILERRDQTELFFVYIDIGLFDLALDLVKDDSTENERIAVNDCGKALCKLARKPSAFASKNPGIWKTLIKSCTTCRDTRELNQTDDALKLVRFLWKKVLNEPADSGLLQIFEKHPALLFEAAELGNFKFLAELICLCPRLIWEKNKEGQTIFHIAVLHRHVNIFNQIHKIGSIKDIIIAERNDGPENNILHLAAQLPLPSRLNVVPGAALQMQRELIWFQEVEKIVQPSSREKKNSEGLTPRELFTKEHTNLLKEGEKWMMDRAHYCMLVATLITTVVFAAAFSVPGGNNDIEGTPNHLEENWFQVFAVSDAIAFSFSSCSTLVFLSILTSRYTEKAFLKLLPYKLMAGLLTLFISMIAMMLAFTAAFFVAYNHKKRWVPMLTFAMAFLPVAVFGLQYSLFSDIFKYTILSKSLFQPSKPMIC